MWVTLCLLTESRLYTSSVLRPNIGGVKVTVYEAPAGTVTVVFAKPRHPYTYLTTSGAPAVNVNDPDTPGPPCATPSAG